MSKTQTPPTAPVRKASRPPSMTLIPRVKASPSPARKAAAPAPVAAKKPATPPPVRATKKPPAKEARTAEVWLDHDTGKWRWRVIKADHLYGLHTETVGQGGGFDTEQAARTKADAVVAGKKSPRPVKAPAAEAEPALADWPTAKAPIAAEPAPAPAGADLPFWNGTGFAPVAEEAPAISESDVPATKEGE